MNNSDYHKDRYTNDVEFRKRCNNHMRKHRVKHKKRMRDELVAKRAELGNFYKRDLLNHIRYRAKKKNIPFDIDVNDINIPEFCPILGYKLKYNTKRGSPDSPSIDRIIPEKGYTKGNIVVISTRANIIKNNASLFEIEQIYKYFKKVIEHGIS